MKMLKFWVLVLSFFLFFLKMDVVCLSWMMKDYVEWWKLNIGSKNRGWELKLSMLGV